MTKTLTMKEVAAHLGVGLSVAYRYARRKDFPVVPIKSTLNAWMRDRRKEALGKTGRGRPLAVVP